jgi:hypothetical protein
VPLIACLLALSVWPAAISSHSFGHADASQTVSQQLAGRAP